MNTKKLMAASACLGSIVFLSGCGSSVTTQPASIGTVDTQLIMEAHPSMAGAKTAMNEEYAQVQNELKDTTALSPDEKKSKINELRKRLSDKEKAQITPIKESADKAVNTVMKKYGLTIVLDKKAVVSENKDITKDVLIEEGLSEQDAAAAIEKADSK